MPGDRFADNPYRRGGLLIERRAFRDFLDADRNVVEILV
jgi:hypothetical protein